MPGKALYFTRFVPSLEKGGGSRRMLQIRQALDFLDPELVSSGNNDRLNHEALQRIKSNIEKKQHYLSRLDARRKRWTDEHGGYVIRLREVSKEWIESCAEIPDLKVAVMDDPIYFLPLFKHLRKREIPVIAVCHNLEGLADDRMDKGPSLKLFRQEVSILARCGLVITISNEEGVILTNLGVPCMHIPYYPADPVCRRGMAIRSRREGTEKKDVLMLGNARNSPTRRGMQDAIGYWCRNFADRNGEKLLVAGFHTEKYFAAEGFCRGVKLLGTLPEEALDATLSGVKACLCFQSTGAGALTRICEMLVAGVPVLANSHAARSYYGMEGLLEFREWGELESLLRRLDGDAGLGPIPPPPPSVKTACLIQAVLNLMQGN